MDNSFPQKPARQAAPSIMAVAGVPIGVRSSCGIGEVPDDDENGRITIVQGIGLLSSDSNAFQSGVFDY